MVFTSFFQLKCQLKLPNIVNTVKMRNVKKPDLNRKDENTWSCMISLGVR